MLMMHRFLDLIEQLTAYYDAGAAIGLREVMHALHDGRVDDARRSLLYSFGAAQPFSEQQLISGPMSYCHHPQQQQQLLAAPLIACYLAEIVDAHVACGNQQQVTEKFIGLGHSKYFLERLGIVVPAMHAPSGQRYAISLYLRAPSNN